MNKKFWLTFVAVAAAVVMYGVSVSAQPGDTSDPLVSKTYVDGQINQLKTLINNLSGTSGVSGTATLNQSEKDAMVAEVLAYIETVYGESLRNTQAGAVQPVQSSSEEAVFTVVHAYKGQTLMGQSSTEIILRGGTATAVTGVNGLCDITGGADVMNGMNIKTNHLLIVPVGDGRGMTFTSDAYLMIKGGYYFV